MQKLLQAARLPAAFGYREHVLVGGLLSYGELRSRLRAGRELRRPNLAGAKPSDLPVEQPTRFELTLNLKTVAALGLTIPQTVLISADELVQ